LGTRTTYTVKLTNANGCVGAVSAPAAITANPLPDPPVMAGSSSYCGSGTITATAGDGGTGIQWDDGSTASLRTVNASGNYSAITTSAAGCTSSTATVTVTIGTPSASGSAPDATCGCAEGLTACNGSCYASGVAEWTVCSHTGFTYVSDVSYECSVMNWSTADKYCKDKGMNLPTREQIQCMCTNKFLLPGDFVGSYYWSSTAYDSDYYSGYFGNCFTTISTPSLNYYVKCVKE
jgi:hypothetical protein